jgi:hypothetical protein
MGGMPRFRRQPIDLERQLPGVPADEWRRRLQLADKLLRLSPEKAGETIVRGVEKRRARILVGRDALIIALVERLAPVSYWRVLGRAVPL